MIDEVEEHLGLDSGLPESSSIDSALHVPRCSPVGVPDSIMTVGSIEGFVPNTKYSVRVRVREKYSIRAYGEKWIWERNIMHELFCSHLNAKGMAT